MRSNKVDYRVGMEEFSLNCGEIAVCVFAGKGIR